MAKGKKTGGRQKGSKNKRTLARESAAEGTLPLEFLLEVMRDKENSLQCRVDAAKAAAPYLHARRAPENKQGQTVPPMTYCHPDLEAP